MGDDRRGTAPDPLGPELDLVTPAFCSVGREMGEEVLEACTQTKSVTVPL
jgi:hypothetical protein